MNTAGTTARPATGSGQQVGGVARAPRDATWGGGANRVERMASALLGAVLLTRGVRRPSLGGAAASFVGADLVYRGITGHSAIYRAIGASPVGRRSRRAGAVAAGSPEVERAITIGKPADELYHFWRVPENFSRVMGDFAEMRAVSDTRSHWIVRGPRGRTLEWDSEIVEERPGELLRWESLGGAKVPNEGRVRFRPAPDGWGSEVTLSLRFDPPGGALGDAAAKLLEIVPRQAASSVLRRFKALVETGELPTLAHNPSHRGSGDLI